MSSIACLVSVLIAVLWSVQTVWSNQWSLVWKLSPMTIMLCVSTVNWLCTLVMAWWRWPQVQEDVDNGRAQWSWVADVVVMTLTTSLVANLLYYWVLRQKDVSIPVVTALMYISPIFTWMIMRCGWFGTHTANEASRSAIESQWGWVGIACVVTGVIIMVTTQTGSARNDDNGASSQNGPDESEFAIEE